MAKFRVSYQVVQYADLCIEVEANSSDEALIKAVEKPNILWYLDKENSNGWERVDGPDYEVIEIE